MPDFLVTSCRLLRLFLSLFACFLFLLGFQFGVFFRLGFRLRHA